MRELLPRSTTLGVAKAWLRERLEEGEHCPLCTQFAKIYKRKIHTKMARALILMYRAGGVREFVYMPDVLAKAGQWRADEAKLRYWGLAQEEADGPRDGRQGWWRVTPKGESFALGRIAVPKYARVYDGRCLGFQGEQVFIRDCLGDRFDYDELMRL